MSSADKKQLASFPHYSLEYLIELLENLTREYGEVWTYQDFIKPRAWPGRGTAFRSSYSVSTKRFKQKLADCQRFGLLTTTNTQLCLSKLAITILTMPTMDEWTAAKQHSVLRIALFKTMLLFIYASRRTQAFDLYDLAPYARKHFGIKIHDLNSFLNTFFFSAYFAELLTTGPRDPDAMHSEEACFLYVKGYHNRPDTAFEWLKPRRVA
ncbi:hypothetical protein [Dictyobacter formicarum]|uniref:Uncharacterized protein n=1 Tax=Dictyobacter formicarum TaxID=2778368 RepID=A0ABQ3VI01_9CHLR|nr:hypothetical protein [Dictyobacter formicarum]GHO85253.1 hypothetical protein KSZ_32590 [Dictyobacter formicarum]